MTIVLTIAFAVMCGLLILFFSLGIGKVFAKKDTDEQFHTMIESITKSEIELERQDANIPDPKTWSGYWYALSARSGTEFTKPTTPGTLAMGSALFLGLAGFLVYPGDLLGGVAGVAAALIGLRFYFVAASNKRLRSMEKQLPQLLSGIRANLQANLTPQQAITSQAKEITAPLGDELKKLTEEMSVGIALDEALQNLATRVPSREIKFLVSAIRIAIASGADLAPLVEKIEHIVIQRQNIANKLASAVAKVQPAIGVTGIMIPAAYFYSFYSTDDNRAYWTSIPVGLITTAIVAALYALGLFIAKKQVDRVKEA
jgi:Flp pilus assembly protein TadB